jgi:hypothetical protein
MEETPRSVSRMLSLYAFDFFLDVKFFAFQVSQNDIVNRWMGHCLRDFILECSVLFYQRLKMRFYRHEFVSLIVPKEWGLYPSRAVMGRQIKVLHENNILSNFR